MQALVIGAGFAGAVCARELADAGYNVTVIERRAHIGGNAYERARDNGVRVHEYGPHLFHTSSAEVMAYLERFATFTPYRHCVVGRVDGQIVPIPFNFRGIDLLYQADEGERLKARLLEAYAPDSRVSVLALMNHPDAQIAAFGEYVCEKVFRHYTAKQWGVSIDKIDTSTIDRVPVVMGYQDEYFGDLYQCMPEGGFNSLFDALLDSPMIDVRLNTDAQGRLTVEDGVAMWDGEPFHEPIIYTGCVDKLLGDRFGELPYRTLRLQFEDIPIEDFQGHAVVNYPNEEAFTRITEFKHITGQRCAQTSILREYPQAWREGEQMEPYYPIQSERSKALYERYAAELKRCTNLHLCGRLAEYRYYNMDQAVLRALEVSRAARA